MIDEEIETDIFDEKDDSQPLPFQEGKVAGIDYTNPPLNEKGKSKSTIDTLKAALDDPIIKESLKNNPDVINDLIDTLPGAGKTLARAYIGMYHPDLMAALDGGGDEEKRKPRRGREEHDDEDNEVTIEDHDEAIKWAYERKKMGWNNGKISKFAYEEFGIDQTPAVWGREIRDYEDSLGIESLYTENRGIKDKQAKVMQQILDRTKGLEEQNRILTRQANAANNKFLLVAAYVAGFISMYVVGRVI